MKLQTKYCVAFFLDTVWTINAHNTSAHNRVFGSKRSALSNSKCYLSPHEQLTKIVSFVRLCCIMIQRSRTKLAGWLSIVIIITCYLTTCIHVYLSDSSPTERCAAKHAIAHMRIWMPWYNCLPRMSQTPWFGITWALVCTMTVMHQQNTTIGHNLNKPLLPNVKLHMCEKWQKSTCPRHVVLQLLLKYKLN